MAERIQQHAGHGGKGGGDKGRIWNEFQREWEEMNWKQQVHTTLQRYFFLQKGRKAIKW